MSDHASHYAQLHRRYLQRNRRKFYDALVRDGELNDHLRSVGQRAAEMYEAIIGQMANSSRIQNLPYEEKVKELQALPLIADELVMDDVVYQPRD
jgi:hypothetical protein